MEKAHSSDRSGGRSRALSQIQMRMKRRKEREPESRINGRRRRWKNVSVRRMLLLSRRWANLSSQRNKKRKHEDDVRLRSERSFFPL